MLFRSAYGAGIEGCSDLSVNAVDPADVTPGAIFLGGAGVSSGVQQGSVTAIDVATAKQTAKHDNPYPYYSGVLVTPDLVWSASMDGAVEAYDAKTLAPLWSMNVGSSFSAPPMTYTANGKQYIAILGGGNSLATFGHPDLAIKQAANMLWVFALD